MAKFFAGVWLGENQFGFDLFEAARTLEPTDTNLIIDWLNNPTFP